MQRAKTLKEEQEGRTCFVGYQITETNRTKYKISKQKYKI